ncbi:macro domain-containing protein [Streptomyces sp. NPDC005533]|uniref:macro domain-containing protein n=1 Tax=Streptomyces sp. NPDC005533 TaxID=3364723 RepID=UPI003685B165
MSRLLLGVTGVLIAAGVGLQVWASGPRGQGRQYALQLPSVLLYSLASALFLYSTFPDSVSEGRAMGFGLGGAAGFAGFFMLVSYSWLSKTRPHDETASALKAAAKENARLRKRLDSALAAQDAPVPPARSTRYEVPLKDSRRHHLGMITGNLANVLGVDVWVNPENTQMDMSRITEPTISATIRYHGGTRDAGGHLVKDRIALELAGKMAGQTHVAAGQVLSTGSGELLGSHQVKRIVHVAAVEGEPASGFRQVMDLERCVRNLLGEVDRLNEAGEGLRSVVLPLLGTGGGNSDLRRTAEGLAAAVAGYFQAHPASRIRTVYLLAYTDVQAEVCRSVITLLPELMDPPEA